MTTVTDDVTLRECLPPSRRPATRSVRGYATGKDDYLVRLRRIEGQIRGLQKMIDADRWCPDVITQITAATSALQDVAVSLLTDHLHHCVIDSVMDSANSEARLDEVAATIRQVVRR